MRNGLLLSLCEHAGIGSVRCQIKGSVGINLQAARTSASMEACSKEFSAQVFHASAPHGFLPSASFRPGLCRKHSCISAKLLQTLMKGTGPVASRDAAGVSTLQDRGMPRESGVPFLIRRRPRKPRSDDQKEMRSTLSSSQVRDIGFGGYGITW